MVSVAFHAPLLGKNVPQRHRQIAVAGGIETGVPLAPPGVRHQSHTQGVLPVGGGVGEGVVIIVEDDALVGHPVQRGRQFRVDGGAGKRLRAQHNQIVILQHPGVFVFLGAGKTGAVIVQRLDALILCFGRQGIKINVQYIVSIYRLLHFRLPGGFKIVRFRFPPEHFLELQTEGGQQTETVCRLVSGSVVPVVVAVNGVKSGTANPQGQQHHHLQHRCRRQQDQPGSAQFSEHRFPREFPQQACNRDGQQPHQQRKEIFQNRQHHLFEKTGHCLAAHAHHRQGIHGAKNGMIHDLGIIQHAQDAYHDQTDQSVSPPVSLRQAGKDHSDHHSESDQVRIPGRNPTKDRPMQHGLQIQQRQHPEQGVSCQRFQNLLSLRCKKLLALQRRASFFALAPRAIFINFL